MQTNPGQIKIIPLTVTTPVLLVGEANGFMLWHLHVNNNDPAVAVTVEIHAGDVTTPGLPSLIISIPVPPAGSDSIPVTLTNMSFPPGMPLYAKASAANKANVVLNVGVNS